MQKYFLFIGVDISKKKIDVALSLDGEKRSMELSVFPNNESGFARMVGWATGHARKKGNAGGRCIFCLEYTGVYADPLCSYLHAHGLDYVLENALQVNRSVGIRRAKNDPADAADLAGYIHAHHRKLALSTPADPGLLKIKNLLGLYRRFKKARHGIRVAARELKAFSPETVHGRVVGLSGETEKHLDGQIKETLSCIGKAIGDCPELDRLYGLVSSVVGVQLVIGANLLVYTNAFRSFTDPRKFACHIGLAPFGQTSGTSVHVPDKVSHLANKRLKALVGNGAMCAIRHDPQIKAYYDRRLEEGKNKFLVQNNVKNKLVHRIFAVVKRGTPYVKLANH
jgi:transposase